MYLGILQVKYTGGYEKLAFFDQYLAFNSKTVKDTAIVTMEDEYELVSYLSNGAISNHLERPPSYIKVMIF